MKSSKPTSALYRRLADRDSLTFSRDWLNECLMDLESRILALAECNLPHWLWMRAQRFADAERQRIETAIDDYIHEQWQELDHERSIRQYQRS
jgi:hypothetical protein